jgi:hypothetical protein
MPWPTTPEGQDPLAVWAQRCGQQHRFLLLLAKPPSSSERSSRHRRLPARPALALPRPLPCRVLRAPRRSPDNSAGRVKRSAEQPGSDPLSATMAAASGRAVRRAERRGRLRWAKPRSAWRRSYHAGSTTAAGGDRGRRRRQGQRTRAQLYKGHAGNVEATTGPRPPVRPTGL